MHNKEIKKEAK